MATTDTTSSTKNDPVTRMEIECFGHIAFEQKDGYAGTVGGAA
jgi:hypothetical protein